MGNAPLSNLLGSSRALGTINAQDVAIVDGAGNQITAFGGSGGTSAGDDAAFTIGGASSITPAGFLADETTPDSVDEGDVGVARMTLARKQLMVISDANSEVHADVRDLANSNPLDVAIVDGAGDQITSFGGGVQYTEGDLDTTITGTAMLFETNTGTSALGVVSATNPLPVADNGGSLTVDVGTALPAGTNNIGDMDILSIAAGDNNIGNVDVVTLPALAAGTNNIGDVDVLTVPAPLNVTGGGVELGTLRVTIANDSTGVLSVDDNAGSLTVDVGTALPAGTNNIGDVDVLTLPALPAGTNNIGDVDVLTVPAPLNVTGTGVELGALRVTLASDSTGVLSVDDNGASLTVDVGTALPAGTNNIGDVDVLSVPAPLNVTGTGVELGALRVTLATDSTGVLSVDDNGASLTVDVGTALPAGTNNIGDVDVLTLPALAAGTNNIGDVDVLSIAAGTNNIGDVDIASFAAGAITEVQGDVAHDAAAAGNPVLLAGIAQDMDDTAPPNQVSAEADAVRVAVDRDGAIFVRPFGPRIWSYHENSSSALTDAAVHAAPGVGLSLYVTDIVVSTGAATALNVFFEEGAATVLGPYYLEAVAGRGVVIHFMTPKKITANTALTVTTSAAIAHGIDVTGFIAQG